MKFQDLTVRHTPCTTNCSIKMPDRSLSVTMLMDVEIDHVPFHVHADGESAVLSFNSFSDAIVLLKKYKVHAGSNTHQVISFTRLMSKIGLTIYFHNRHFGFIGPKANLILSKLFTLVTSTTNKTKASLV